MQTDFTARVLFRRTLAAAAALLLPLSAGCAALPDSEDVSSGVHAAPDAADPGTAIPPGEADALDGALDEYASGTGAEFSAAVYDTVTGRSWYYNRGESYLEASLVKVPILLTLLRQATEEQRELTLEEEYLSVMMIEYSDNDATTALYQSVGGAGELSLTYELLGITETAATEIWGVNETGVEDQLKIARAVLDGVDWISSDLHDYAVELMENVEESQNWGINAGLLDSGAEIALKNGWLQDDDLSWNVGSAGFVRAGGSEYAVVVLTSGTAAMEDGVSVVEHVAAVINSFETTGTIDTGTDPNNPATGPSNPGTDANNPGTDTNIPGTNPGTDTNTPGTGPSNLGTDANNPDTNTPGTDPGNPATDPNTPSTGDTDSPVWRPGGPEA